MEPLEKWIWLDQQRYPNRQSTVYSGFLDKADGCYTVAEFTRRYEFDKVIASVRLRFSGDTEFTLYLNGRLLATGPASAGGDFLFNDFPRPQHYASEIMANPNCRFLDFFARVKMMPVGINEYSQGRGGFMLTAYVTFVDGSKAVITTDRTWQARRNGAYTAPYAYDGRIAPDPYAPAQPIPNIWHCLTSPLPPRTEEKLLPPGGRLTLAPGEIRQAELPFDRIYAGFIGLSVQAQGELRLTVCCFETGETGSQEHFIFNTDSQYRGLQLHSIGGYRLTAENRSGHPASLEVSLIATCYPAPFCARTVTSDPALNRVLEVSTHTLKYCRQLMHLDSPRHSEPLACTGDYYIESLMTAFSFGDMTLAAFDVRRTAQLLRYQDGRMFHTTYSLIWVLMLYDIYRYTGDKALLADCEDALTLLLARFETYLGKNGLIETPPDYMFVDWIYIDGISLHHPPKALGQSCLNLFYFGALQAAEKIFLLLDAPAMAGCCAHQASSLRSAVNTLLYDRDRGLYFEGLNTPTPEALLAPYMPQNVQKRYYRRHANILAAYFGICDMPRARAVLKQVMEDESLGAYQPYFAHFLLEAIDRCGLRENYTLPVLERWKAPVAACSKGLVEGFLPPEPTYSFDHSHAWGGTPVYALPKALLGFDLLEPGFRKIRLSPSLLGLSWARVELPTPFGLLTCQMRAGDKPVLTIPDGIEVSYGCHP